MSSEIRSSDHFPFQVKEKLNQTTVQLKIEVSKKPICCFTSITFVQIYMLDKSG